MGAGDIRNERASKVTSIWGRKFVECLWSQVMLAAREEKNRRKTGNVLTEAQAAHDFLKWVETSDG